MSGELNMRLQILQNSCVRYICGARRDERISPDRKKIGWVQVEARRDYFMAVMLYKPANLGQPPCIAIFFDKNRFRTSSRYPKDLVVPESRTNTGLYLLSARAARFWISLPRHMKCLPPLNRFKTAIHRHIYQNNDV